MILRPKEIKLCDFKTNNMYTVKTTLCRQNGKEKKKKTIIKLFEFTIGPKAHVTPQRNVLNETVSKCNF